MGERVLLPFYTVAEVARLLRCTPRTVRRMIQRGELDATKKGGRLLIPLATLRTDPHVWIALCSTGPT